MNEAERRKKAQEWGSKGGKATAARGGGFKGMTKEERREWGRIGNRKRLENAIKNAMKEVEDADSTV